MPRRSGDFIGESISPERTVNGSLGRSDARLLPWYRMRMVPLCGREINRLVMKSDPQFLEEFEDRPARGATFHLWPGCEGRARFFQGLSGIL